jgi:predicted DNA-binding protein (UPF0251 family)
MPVGGCPSEAGCPKEANYVAMTLEELEAVRLVDLLELEQEEAASFMGISRKAFWNDLTNARRKIAMALVDGRGIRIEGGSYVLRDMQSADAGERVPPISKNVRALPDKKEATASKDQAGPA